MRIPNCLCNGGHGPDGGLDGPDYWLNDNCPIHGDEAWEENDEDEEVVVAAPRFTAPGPIVFGPSGELHVQLRGLEFHQIILALEDRAFMLRRKGPRGRHHFDLTLDAWKRLVIAWHGSIANYPPYATIIPEWDDPAWDEEDDPWAA